MIKNEKKSVESIIKSSPYFKRKKKIRDSSTFLYVFHDGKEKFEIKVNKRFDPHDYKPVTYETYQTIRCAPMWFRELLKEVNEHYFFENRIRMISSKGRRTLKNLLFFYSLTLADGYKFNIFMDNLNVNKEKRMSIKYKEEILSFFKELEKWKYHIKITNQDTEFISFIIS